MLKLLSSVSVIALLSMTPAAAQTTTQEKSPTATPPATSQGQSTTAPSTAQDKSTTSPSTAQEKSTTTPSTAQDKSTTSPSTAQEKSTTAPSTTAQSGTAAITLTEDEAKAWVDKPVYSSAGNEIGEVVEFKRGSDNKVTELVADIGGFLGMGESRVKINPSEFKLEGDRVVLNLTEEQAKALPKVEK